MEQSRRRGLTDATDGSEVTAKTFAGPTTGPSAETVALEANAKQSTFRIRATSVLVDYSGP